MAGEGAQSAATAGPPSVPGIYRPVQAGERLFQGEILERVIEWVPAYKQESPDEVKEAEPRLRKLVVVMTQDCDLAQDWNKRSQNLRADSDLLSILLCPASPAEELKEAQNIDRERWKPIRSNKNERYQYLTDASKDCDQVGEGHSAILIDFRSLFSLRTVELYRQLRAVGVDAPRRRFRLETPWAEHLQCRFAAYHSRIGLPRDHFVPEGRRVEGAAPQ